MKRTTRLDDDVAVLANSAGRCPSPVSNEVSQAGLRAAQAGAQMSPYVPPVFDTGRPFIEVTEIAEVLKTLDEA